MGGNCGFSLFYIYIFFLSEDFYVFLFGRCNFFIFFYFFYLFIFIFLFYSFFFNLSFAFC